MPFEVKKKLTTAVLTILFLIFEKKLGLDLDMETKMMITGVASSYIVGQGFADKGKEAEKVKLEGTGDGGAS